ncbi:MAG: hypothetical protein K2L77_08965 [Muribaculaceae bacterium]|nr:hypothetical protein [Muribaculaceae bacterium]
MNTDYNKLSTEELEQLAEAFFNCDLERHEETALARVLAFSDIHSPLLDSCRHALGLESCLKHSRRRTARSSRRIWMTAAASTALLATVSALILSPGDNRDSHELSAEVYMSGKRVTNCDLARSLALRDMESELKAFNKAMEDAAIQRAFTENEIKQSKQLINQIKTNNDKL